MILTLINFFLFSLIFFSLFFSNGCINYKIIEIEGSSMEPFIYPGEKLIFLENYPLCYNLKRGDLVSVYYAGANNLLLKRIIAVPGDYVELRKDKNSWLLLVNGVVAKNSEGKSYIFDKTHVSVWRLYFPNMSGYMPENDFLVLSNIPEGGLDSRVFGLVNKKDIKGKVIKNKLLDMVAKVLSNFLF